MPERVRTARFCLNVAGLLLWATAALLIYILTRGAGLAGGDPERLGLARTMLPGSSNLVASFVLIAAGLILFVISAGVRRGQAWSRYAALAAGVILLPVIVVGTIPGIFIIFGMFGHKAGEWFSGGKPKATRPAAPIKAGTPVAENDQPE